MATKNHGQAREHIPVQIQCESGADGKVRMEEGSKIDESFLGSVLLICPGNNCFRDFLLEG